MSAQSALLRLPRVTELRGRKRSTTYRDIEEGLFPPPIKVGRASVWPEHEILAINAAHVSGKSDDEVRDLVKNLIAARARAFDQFEAA